MAKAKKKDKTFTITAQEQVAVWQDVTYEVTAKNLAEAKRKIKANPKTHCTGVDEVIYDTEEVLDIDFKSHNASVVVS